MILASLLLPIAVAAIVFLVQKVRLPVFLAVMATVVVYGIAADMTFQSVGKAFGLGFATAMEQAGLLVVAGALAGAVVLRAPLGTGTSAAAGVLAGLGASASGGLALLQPAGQDAPRRALGLALTLLVVSALLAPSPLAVAAGSVMKADLSTALLIAVPVAAVAIMLGWWHVARQIPSTDEPGQLSWAWLCVAIPLVLLVVQSIAQMPSEPLGKGGSREFYIGISRPLMLAAIAITLAIVLARRWEPSALAGRSWAPLLLAVGASGGLARVFDETGMAELLAEYVLHPRYGVLTPFLAAAIVKTMQGNSLTAVLTASGMVEPLLPALGLDSASGRAIATAAVGAGSMAVCHVNDPLFWIAAHMGRLSPGRALYVISLGSAVMAIGALIVIAAIRQFV
ncbi:GntP family permease [Reyranella massiliensis]|uniref:GntT/GntP/DsdX family permease n=1 Tax=Reyranella massiliensis TaxID=445220 RepID=UPI0002D6458E|nr:GntP family permease [Reyranella massiliensis]